MQDLAENRLAQFPAREAQPRPGSLLIEGWRGVNHSFALVNQHQILEMLGIEGVRLFHHDLPYAFDHWTKSNNSAGFPPEERRRIDSLRDRGDEPVDCLYRICSPFRVAAQERCAKLVTFMTTELCLASGSFAPDSADAALFIRDENCIVAPTRWARDRIVDFGFDADKVHVVPHGVDTAAFHPPSAAERNVSRANLGIQEDETVFLNVGVAIWNKGIDLLLEAFSQLRSQGRRVRLVLKDQRDVYGISVEKTVQQVGGYCSALLQPDVLGAISVIPGNLSQTQLRLLYGIADCYVSPYRAEGFNLPVLEAIACGKRIITTRGGATDDFCDDAVARRLSGRAGTRAEPRSGQIGRYIEPDLDDLIDAMTAVATGAPFDEAAFTSARQRILGEFTWKRAARELACLTLGEIRSESAQDPAGSGAAAAELGKRKVSQRDILDLVAMIKPRAMEACGKVRIGGARDSGFVVPAIALECDSVLSIGVQSGVEFDLEMAERGASIIQFDHRADQPPVAHRNVRFHKFGWGRTTGEGLLEFADIAAKLSAVDAKRPILKFDIDGSEYDAFETTQPDQLIQFEVLACEIHDLSRLAEPDFYGRARATLEKLTRHHTAVHLHANNHGRVVMVEGVPIPDILELTLLRSDLGAFNGLSSEPIPGPLDRPNHPLKPDICMNAFQA